MNSSDNKAVYVQLMESIIEKISKGEYRVGEKILSERKMAERYGINRLTVRNAIKHLIQEGYLVSIHGKGTFVNSMPKSDKKVKFGQESDVSLSSTLRQSGFKTSRKVLSFKKIPITEEVKKFFDCKEVYELIRLSLIDNDPYALQLCYFPSDVFSDPERFDFSNDSLYTYMDSQGHMPTNITSLMEIIPLPECYRDIMEIDSDKLVFYYEYYGNGENGEMLEFTKAYYKPEYTSFTYITRK